VNQPAETQPDESPEPTEAEATEPTAAGSTEPTAAGSTEPTAAGSTESTAAGSTESTEATLDAPAPSGRQKLLRDLSRARRTQLVVAVLLALVGFGAVTQVRTNEADSSYAGYREQDLIDVLNGLSTTTQRAQTELTRLEQRRDQLQSTTMQRQAAVDEARTEVDTLNILAGEVPVTGPGVRVTITEQTAGINVDSFIDLVQELRSSGAEAIQVNGKVRIVAQSSFDKTEGGLLVDGTVVEAPYVVDAIGEPGTLAGAMTFLNGPADEFKDDGASVKVDKLNKLDIRAVRPSGASGAGSSGSASAQ
jgi:uncharacterized protein YlxW (UPF0749 family)